jgi:hypothetical protein
LPRYALLLLTLFVCSCLLDVCAFSLMKLACLA